MCADENAADVVDAQHQNLFFCQARGLLNPVVTLHDQKEGIADNGAGPRHRGVFGCRAATQPGFEYSDALRQSGIVWDEKTLDRWLSDPSAFVPGNMMVVRLANEAADRADLIAFLQSVSQGERSCKPGTAMPAAVSSSQP